jgi:ClpP class serine protease
MAPKSSRGIDLCDRFFNQPALISRDLADRLRAEYLANPELTAPDMQLEFDAKMFDRMLQGDRPYRMVGPVAVVPVTGSLYHRMNYQWRYATGYDFIAGMTELAEKDPGVKGIAYDFHTGGGQVDGAFESAARIKAAKKPTRAIINSSAYSAGYLLASATDKRIITQTGGAGSIGVVTMHVDYSKMLDDIGYDITFIFAGSHKVDGNSYEPLPDSVRARYQERIDALYSLFTNTVADYTGLSVEDVVATQADTFTADEALRLGLVDAIDDPQDALQAFVAELNGDNKRSLFMTTPTSNAEQPETQAEGAVTQAAMETAVSAAKTEGVKLGVTQERERTKAVLSSEHYVGREKMALKLLDTEMSAEQITGVLAEALAAPAAAAQSNAFEQAMESGNPEVGSGETTGAQEQSVADRMLASYGMASGQKLN